jgi:hypothetical protein
MTCRGWNSRRFPGDSHCYPGRPLTWPRFDRKRMICAVHSYIDRGSGDGFSTIVYGELERQHSNAGYRWGSEAGRATCSIRGSPNSRVTRGHLG